MTNNTESFLGVEEKKQESASISSNKTENQESSIGSNEGYTAYVLGITLIWVSLSAAIICILAFGQIEVRNAYYGSSKQWSPALVTYFSTAGLSGMLFGYLLAKVGSILRRLERLQPSI